MLDKIELFLDVYRAGSFAAVARQHNVAPSSVSRRIAALEAQLEARLFQRTTRKLMPTSAGEAYYTAVAEHVDALELAASAVSDKAANQSGTLRVTASVSYGQVVIAPRLKAFRDAYPDIQLELILSDRRVDMIEEQIDIAIRHGTLPDSDLIARKIVDVKYLLVASPDYLQHAPPLNVPEQLQDHEVLSFSHNAFRNTWTFRDAETERPITISPVFRTTNALALRQAAENGIGVALLADWTAEEAVHAGRLVHLLPELSVFGADEHSAIWLVFPSRRYIPARARAFCESVLGLTP